MAIVSHKDSRLRDDEDMRTHAQLPSSPYWINIYQKECDSGNHHSILHLILMYICGSIGLICDSRAHNLFPSI